MIIVRESQNVVKYWPVELYCLKKKLYHIFLGLGQFRLATCKAIMNSLQKKRRVHCRN